MPPGSGGTNRYALLAPGPKPKSVKRKAMTIGDFDLEFPSAPEAKRISKLDQPKYITLEYLDGDNNIRSVCPFKLRRSVDAISTEFYKRPGYAKDKLLMLCKNDKIAQRFLKVSMLKDVGNVKFAYHPTLNLVKGTIYNRYLAMRPVDYIVENLAIDGVVDAYCPKRLVEGKEVATGLIILVFDKYDLPNEVDAGYEKCKVKPYFPNPLRCKKCQKIGHTAKWCKFSTQICDKCAFEIPHENCTRKYCVNCNLDTHASSDRNCPKFLSEKEILKIRTVKKCSIYEARKEYYASLQARPLIPVTPSLSFADAAKTGPVTTTKITVPKTFNFTAQEMTSAPTKDKAKNSKELQKDDTKNKEAAPNNTTIPKVNSAGPSKLTIPTAHSYQDFMEIDKISIMPRNNPRLQRVLNKKSTLSANNSDNNSSSTEPKINVKKGAEKKPKLLKKRKRGKPNRARKI